MEPSSSATSSESDRTEDDIQNSGSPAHAKGVGGAEAESSPQRTSPPDVSRPSYPDQDREAGKSPDVQSDEDAPIMGPTSTRPHLPSAKVEPEAGPSGRQPESHKASEGGSPSGLADVNGEARADKPKVPRKRGQGRGRGRGAANASHIGMPGFMPGMMMGAPGFPGMPYGSGQAGGPYGPAQPALPPEAEAYVQLEQKVHSIRPVLLKVIASANFRTSKSARTLRSLLRECRDLSKRIKLETTEIGKKHTEARKARAGVGIEGVGPAKKKAKTGDVSTVQSAEGAQAEGQVEGGDPKDEETEMQVDEPSEQDKRKEAVSNMALPKEESKEVVPKLEGPPREEEKKENGVHRREESVTTHGDAQVEPPAEDDDPIAAKLAELGAREEDVSNMSVRGLKDALTILNVGFKDCIEKSELALRLKSSLARLARQN